MSDNENTSKALLKVSFTAAGIGLEIRDEVMENENARNHGMDQKRVRATKKILTGVIDPVNSEVGKIRRFLKLNTFEGIGGTRIMVAAEADRITRQVNKFTAAATEAVTDIADNLEELINSDRGSEGLGDRFDRDNYPASGFAFQQAFSFDLHIEPMPDPASFRLIKELTETEREHMAQRLEAQLTSARHRMQSETIARTMELIKEVSDTLGDPDKPIVDSEGRKGCIPRLRDHLNRLPMLNIDNNPQLTRLRDEVLSSLDLSTDALRTQKGTRATTAFLAGNIHKKFSNGFSDRAISA
jgi:hypothetical protein